VIAELNRYFVPVTSSNSETGDGGAASPAEKAERQRIYGDFAAKNLGTGAVHIYVLRPDGSGLRGADGLVAFPPGKLLAFLEGVRRELKTPEGPPAFPPHPASPPPVPADSMVFHLVARGSPHNSWDRLPSENWIVLNHTEWGALLPPEPTVARRSSWTVSRRVSDILLAWFYPQIEEASQVPRGRIDNSDLRMVVTTIQNGVARARIEGWVKIRIPPVHKGKGEDTFASAPLIGFMDFGPSEDRIQRLGLITKDATYLGYPFDVALRSVSRETLDARR
jgi:hypothetical protein